MLVDVTNKEVYVLTNHGRHTLTDTVGASLGASGREAVPTWERDSAFAVLWSPALEIEGQRVRTLNVEVWDVPGEGGQRFRKASFPLVREE